MATSTFGKVNANAKVFLIPSIGASSESNFNFPKMWEKVSTFGLLPEDCAKAIAASKSIKESLKAGPQIVEIGSNNGKIEFHLDTNVRDKDELSHKRFMALMAAVCQNAQYHVAMNPLAASIMDETIPRDQYTNEEDTFMTMFVSGYEFLFGVFPDEVCMIAHSYFAAAKKDLKEDEFKKLCMPLMRQKYGNESFMDYYGRYRRGLNIPKLRIVRSKGLGTKAKEAIKFYNQF